MFLAKCLSLLSALAAVVVSQDVGFAVDGYLADAAVTDTSLYNTGGSISVNGWNVVVPKNLQVGFPAAWVPWKDFVASLGTFRGYEVSVTGNVVGGKAIAAQVYISQLFLQASQGTIQAVNDDGSMQIANGPKIRINDPNGVYSIGYKGSPFMTADDENPSISSWGGFPMCVPRNASDPLCPASNRPGNKQGVFTAPEPLLMAPFVPGDFVEYSGYTNGAGEIVCFEIAALNVQISTGGTFSFLRVEDAIVGAYSADPNAESAETRFIGYTSEKAGSPVKVSAIELDPCTGAETLRNINMNGFIDAGDVRNKFVIRKKAAAGDTYTREYVLTTASGSKTTLNQIKAGYYVQPVTEWIQPELAVPGAKPVAFEFAQMKHLTQGLGADENGNIWGPLDPFPQSGVKVFDPSTCPKIVPSPTSTTPAATTTPAASDPSGGSGSGTDPVTTSSTTSSALVSPATPTAIPVDTVKVVAATWASQNGGTFAVSCSSSNTNNTLVGMQLDYVLNGVTTRNVTMVESTNPGQWTYSAKLKQPTTVTCKSKLKGNATAAVTTRKRRRQGRSMQLY